MNRQRKSYIKKVLQRMAAVQCGGRNINWFDGRRECATSAKCVDGLP